MRRIGFIAAGLVGAATGIGISWPVTRALEVYGQRDQFDALQSDAAVTVRSVLAAEIEAYAVYVNAPRGFFADDELVLLDLDTEKARVAMERAWLEHSYQRHAPEEKRCL